MDHINQIQLLYIFQELHHALIHKISASVVLILGSAFRALCHGLTAKLVILIADDLRIGIGLLRQIAGPDVGEIHIASVRLRDAADPALFGVFVLRAVSEGIRFGNEPSRSIISVAIYTSLSTFL